MSLNSSWAPSGISNFELWGERSFLDGILIAAVAYGVHVILFALCFRMILSTRHKSMVDWINLAYICTVFTLGTLGNAFTMRWCEMVFVDNINFPGGPLAFSAEESTTWVYASQSAIYIVSLWLADALLLYRFFVIWRRRIYVIVLPFMAYCVSIVLGCLLIYEFPRPIPPFSPQLTTQLPIVFWSLSIAFNVLLTLAIIGRLLYMRWKIRSILASTALTPYVSISAMLIESAVLFTANGLTVVVSLALENPVQDLATPVLGQTQSIAPLMIIYRVLQGKAWSMKTHQSLDHSVSVLIENELYAAGGPHQDLMEENRYVNDTCHRSSERTSYGDKHVV